MKIGKNYIDLNVENIYTEYLEHAQKDAEYIRGKEYNDRLFASNAGLCYRKLYYHEKNMPKKKTDETGLRTMRLGTIFGFDFERAISWYFDKYSEHLQDVKYYTEEYIYDDKFSPPLGGHFDILFVDESDKWRRGYLIDVKTTNLWKFQAIFGKKPEKDPSYNYEMQLGTYAALLERDKRFCDEVVYMSNVYFNKNSSVIKFREAAPIFKQYAIDYWKTYTNYKGEEPPLKEYSVPFYKKWECDWCNYSLICDSPHIKKRKVKESK